MKHRCAILAVLAVTAGVCACDDPENSIVQPDPSPFPALTTRDAVLINIESAYNTRRAGRYENVLDASFTFIPSAGDVGGDIPPSWDREDEVALHERLFNATLDEPPYPRCTSIELDLLLEGVVWEPEPAPAAEGVASEEERYTAEVFYDFVIRFGQDFTALAVPGSKARFTVRNAGTEEAPHWQLVEMWDVSAANLAAEFRYWSTEETTWGGVKALYR